MILRLGRLLCPRVPRTVQPIQSGAVSGGSKVVQVEIGGGDRRVAHPGLNGHRVDAAGQPQTGSRVPQVVDPPPVGDRGPSGVSV